MSQASQQSQLPDDEELLGFAGPMLVNKLQVCGERLDPRHAYRVASRFRKLASHPKIVKSYQMLDCTLSNPSRSHPRRSWPVSRGFQIRKLTKS